MKHLKLQQIIFFLSIILLSQNCSQKSANSNLNVAPPGDINAPILSYVAIASSNSNPAQAKTGDTITISFVASENITTPLVTIAGRTATVTGTGTNFSASLLTDGTEGNGAVPMSISGYADLAGNPGATVTTTTNSSNVNFDSFAPSGYTATIDQTVINSLNQTGTSLSITGAEIGTTYNYTINSTGGGTVTGSGSVTTGSQQITGINTSSISDGTITLSLHLIDSAGNNGAIVTSTKLKDSLAPSGYAMTIDQPAINSLNQAAASFSFTGAEIGAAYSYTISSSGGGTNVTSSGTIATATDTITGISLTTLNDGTLNISVTLTDVAGNPGTAATATVFKDTAPPAGYSVAINQPAINTLNQAAASFSFTGAEVGAAYSYTIGSTGGGTNVTGSGTIATATDTISGINLTTLNDGTLNLSVTLTDVAGNSGIASATVLKDIIPPIGYNVAINQPVINSLNQVAASFSFTGAEVGAAYSYTIISSGGGTNVTGSGTIATATDTISGINATALNDGTLSLSVTLTDVAGNSGAGTVATVLKDIVLPTILSAETLDTNANGKIDHYKIIISKPVADTTFPGYVVNSPGNTQTDWLVAGYSGVVLAHGTFAPAVDTVNDSVIYFQFTESTVFDSGSKPDLTTTAIPGIIDLAGNPLAQIGTLNIVEQDTAAPIVVSAIGSDQTGAKVLFSENVKATTAEIAGNYLITGGVSVSNAAMNNGIGLDGNKVILTTSNQTVNTAYTVTVSSNVTDLATIANGINVAANSGTFAGFTPAATIVAGQRQNTISWGAVTGATSYSIYWETASGVTTASINLVTGAASPYVHANLTQGTTYYYIVTAVVGGVEGAPSDEVNATPLLSPLKTGQTTVYATGDDASFQRGRNPNFAGPTAHATYTADYTTADNDTGLVWKSCVEGLSGATCTTGTASYVSGGSSCSALSTLNGGAGYAGLINWRKPTIEELESLVNFGISNPAIFQANFPGTPTLFFNTLSGSLIPSATQAVWIVNFVYGNLFIMSSTTNGYMRCVSGPGTIIKPVFVDKGNGTVLDKTNNLVWQKCPKGLNNDATCSGTETTSTWSSAVTYCNTLTLAGKAAGSWRLPNITELNSIADKSIWPGPTINGTAFPLGWVNNTIFWSSTTYVAGTTNAWNIDFSSGVRSGAAKTTSYTVRCVTDGP